VSVTKRDTRQNGEEAAMITRVWRGRTGLQTADGYADFLKRTAYPDYGEVEGNRGWMLLRRDLDGSVELMFVSFWESMESVQRYTGGEAERPKYYPEDRAALLELPKRADHYTVLDAQLRF
jgi:heme-degrading monooxygenase HmoA